MLKPNKRTIRALNLLGSGRLVVEKRDGEAMAVVKAKDNSSEGYVTTLNSCTCPDKEYNLPEDEDCKHMRALKIALFLQKKNEKLATAYEQLGLFQDPVNFDERVATA